MPQFSDAASFATSETSMSDWWAAFARIWAGVSHQLLGAFSSQDFLGDKRLNKAAVPSLRAANRTSWHEGWRGQQLKTTKIQSVRLPLIRTPALSPGMHCQWLWARLSCRSGSVLDSIVYHLELSSMDSVGNTFWKSKTQLHPRSVSGISELATDDVLLSALLNVRRGKVEDGPSVFLRMPQRNGRPFAGRAPRVCVLTKTFS